MWLSHLRILAVYCEGSFEGGGWALVRRVKAGNIWFEADDDLKGTSVYGTYGTATSDSSFSMAFADWLTPQTEVLVATGMRA
jgi:hypothetical protein